ncbi:hypothetical protein M9Y10_022026 [Tritrichomonas musculus]|uniref:non-specific serine/threonine protein kinase n=1 Tax=Tritrichomonas musculus TaxID=1915356 RepID=A0ABR2KR39_9EUKA
MSTGFQMPEIGDVINEKYIVTHRIGAGAFGAIFEVQNLENGKLFAVKLENPKSPSPQLQYEYKLYQMLDAPPGIPKAYEYWQEERFRAMVMDRLGYSLGHYFRTCGKILSMKTVLMCTIQMLCRLEYLHQRSFIHRDIKPDNFVFGVGKYSNTLYMIDLGLAKRYRDLHTFVHINYEEDKGLAGTARYVSINVHLGVEQSCRDDLESVGYVIISLVKGKLPWQGLEVASKNEKGDLLSQAKMDTPLEVLCQGLPSEFLNYMTRVRNLRFDERPPYTQLRSLFIGLMVKLNFAFDYQYDWVVNRIQRLNTALQNQNLGKEGKSSAEKKKPAQEPSTSDENKTEEDIDLNAELIIPTNPQELFSVAKAHHMKGSKTNNFLHPLPFFSIINEAARFVGVSKMYEKRMGKSTEDDDTGEGELSKAKIRELLKTRIPKAQKLFLLDPRTSSVPKNPIQTEFETE